MKRKLFSKIAVLVVMLTLCMPISAYAKCPYCDTGSVGELSEQNHRWVTLLGEKIGHAQALYTQLNVRNGYHGIDFDGNPLTLPYGAVGASYEANGKICSETFYVTNKEIGLDFKSEVDFEKGTYKRFDGQVYRIDPSLFANAYYVIREDKTKEIQNYILA